MVYQDFKGKHTGENIIVAGCGTSVAPLENPVPCVTIGVNDIGRLFTPTYTVMINDKRAFRQDRWEHMVTCKSNAIFTHIKNTECDLPIIHQERLVKIQLGRSVSSTNTVVLDKPSVDYTSNSPFVAAIIASWMGAKNIGIIGVDWTDDHFFAKTGTHILNRKLPAIIQEYILLQDALRARGINLYNLSPISRLRLDRLSLDEFIGL